MRQRGGIFFPILSVKGCIGDGQNGRGIKAPGMNANAVGIRPGYVEGLYATGVTKIMRGKA